ncbi:MAG: CSLREA domain-containing protein [Anaerolineales bacterium]|nr:CSLREA domain-containing protein [Anaerolineales bacterium]
MKARTILAQLGLLVSLAGLGWPGSPAQPGTIITVTTTADVLATDGNCALREAILAANTDTAMDGCPAGLGHDTLYLPAGLYTLSLPGLDEDAAATGDLDITGDLDLAGAGTTQTVIDGGQLDRVFQIAATVEVRLSQVTIQHGQRPGMPVHFVNNGGGIANDGRLTLDHVWVYSNTTGTGGGGLYSVGPVTVTASTFSHNTATYGGGAMQIASTAEIQAAAFYANHATSFRAGAIWNNGMTRLVNTTFSDNRSVNGGAIENASGATLVIQNSTLTANEPYGLYNSLRGSVNVANSVLAGNTGLDCYGIAVISQGHNLFGDCPHTGDTTGNVTGPASLGPLQANGGPTLTHLPLPGSPAIDAGPPDPTGSGGWACPPQDQRGFLRPVDGGSGEARCDIGATEYLAAPPRLLFVPFAGR